jgi:hypothetical protein
MATFELSHLAIDDSKRPPDEGCVLEKATARTLSHIEHLYSENRILPMRNINQNFVFRHIRSLNQWRSLTSGSKNKIL